MHSFWMIGIGVSTTVYSCADASTDARVRQWFEQEVASSSQFPSIDHLSLRWTRELHTQMSDAEMHRLADQIGPLVDHPLRDLLRRAEQYRQFGPVKFGKQLWARGSGMWRYNTTQPDARFENYFNPIADFAVTESHSWRLYSSSLDVAYPDSPPDGMELKSLEHGAILLDLDILLTGGLRRWRSADVKLQSVVVQGSAWRIEGRSSEHSMMMVVSGDWDEAHQRGFVATVRIDRERPLPEAPEDRWTLAGWIPLKEGYWIASTAEGRTASGDLRTRLVFHDALPFSDEEFAALVAVPRYDRDDPARGTLTYTSLRDYRSGRQERRGGSAAGSPPPDPLVPRIASRRSAKWYMYAGWTACALIAAWLVVRRLRAAS